MHKKREIRKIAIRKINYSPSITPMEFPCARSAKHPNVKHNKYNIFNGIKN